MAFDKGLWKPNKKQEQFLSIPFSVREALFGGGNGSGKTDLLLMFPLVHHLHENPRFKQVLLRRTFPELRNEVVPRSREIYRKFGAEFNKSDMIWTFPRKDQYGSGAKADGAMIFLGHCETEEDVHKYDSMEINLFTPDELTSLLEFMYLYIGMTRVRTSDKTLPAIIRAAGMPGGIGHTFVKKRFVDPAPKGGKIIIGRAGNKRIYIHSTLDDNIEHIDPAYAKALEGLPEAEKQARRYGSWEAYLGQVFEEFRDKKYPDEPDEALHVIEPFDIPEWWPKLIAIDWGFNAMTWVGYAAISPQRRVYVYREQYWTKTKIEEWTPYVKELIDSESPRVIKLCKSAGQDRGQTHTILEQVSSALGSNVELTSNTAGSRIAGKMLLHEYFRWKQKYVPTKETVTYNQEHAEWLIRNRGMKEYQSYLDSFKTTGPESNLPKCQIFNTCTKLIEAIKACSYEKATSSNKAPEDIAEFDGDDPVDGMRYLIDACDAYFDDANSEMVKVENKDRIAREFAETQDWNKLFARARALDNAEKMKHVAISRYH